MKRVVLLLMLLAPAVAGSGDERAAIFARFDHAEHARTFKRADLGCTSCHQVGLPGAELPLPPDKSCHQCHVSEDGRQRLNRAPSQCGTCHENVQPPDTHTAAWMAWHGTEADASCSTCHARKDCVDCHERRQDPDFRVHDPGFLSVHGIEASAGATCDTCHAQAECTACHGGKR